MQRLKASYNKSEGEAFQAVAIVKIDPAKVGCRG
jgi:hypothetical protein